MKPSRLVALALLLLAACSGDSPESAPGPSTSTASTTSVTAEPTTSTTSPPTSFGTEVTEVFLSGCLATGGSEDGCRCVLTRLAGTMGESELRALATSLATTGEIPGELLRAVRVCLG